MTTAATTKSLDDERNLDDVAKCLFKNLVFFSIAKCLILLLPSQCEGRRKPTAMSCSMELFFLARICTVPSFRVLSLPLTGFIVIPNSLVANR